jgi:hypothetical protein
MAINVGIGYYVIGKMHSYYDISTLSDFVCYVIIIR